MSVERFIDLICSPPLKVYNAFKIFLYKNKIPLGHNGTMAPKSTSELRSALHFRYSIVIPCFIPYR